MLRVRPASFSAGQHQQHQHERCDDSGVREMMIVVRRRVSASYDEHTHPHSLLLRPSHSDPNIPPDATPMIPSDGAPRPSHPGVAAAARRRAVCDPAANPSPPLRPRAASSSPADRPSSPGTSSAVARESASATRGPARRRGGALAPLQLPPRRPAGAAAAVSTTVKSSTSSTSPTVAAADDDPPSAVHSDRRRRRKYHPYRRHQYCCCRALRRSVLTLLVGRQEGHPACTN